MWLQKVVEFEDHSDTSDNSCVSFSHIVDEKHSTINTEVVLQCAITFMIVVFMCYVVSYTLASSGSNPTWLLMTIFIV